MDLRETGVRAGCKILRINMLIDLRLIDLT